MWSRTLHFVTAFHPQQSVAEGPAPSVAENAAARKDNSPAVSGTVVSARAGWWPQSRVLATTLCFRFVQHPPPAEEAQSLP